MKRTLETSIFDIAGPVMIGPSSSHTAGAARLGRLVRQLLMVKPERARIIFHGSFRETYRGHGTDRAAVGGLLGMAADDERIRQALSLAAAAGMVVELATGRPDPPHPNTLEFVLEGAGRELTAVGYSLGGGKIEVREVDGCPVRLSGERPGLVTRHADHVGMVAQVAGQLAAAGVNIAALFLYRQGKGREATMIMETDQVLTEATMEAIRATDGVEAAAVLQPVG